jgi:hypothetical protein
MISLGELCKMPRRCRRRCCCPVQTSDARITASDVSSGMLRTHLNARGMVAFESQFSSASTRQLHGADPLRIVRSLCRMYRRKTHNAIGNGISLDVHAFADNLSTSVVGVAPMRQLSNWRLASTCTPAKWPCALASGTCECSEPLCCCGDCKCF